MKNEALRHSMIEQYNAIAYTHDYLFGFEDRGNIYMVQATAAVLPYILKLDNAGRGNGVALRFTPNRSQKELLKSFESSVLCSKAYFESVYSNSKYNRGEIFEMLVTEHFGQEWEKDNVPFTEAGDIVVDGISYQIKYSAATFCNEKSLARLTACATCRWCHNMQNLRNRRG